jgi:hypothetical protein
MSGIWSGRHGPRDRSIAAGGCAERRKISSIAAVAP